MSSRSILFIFALLVTACTRESKESASYYPPTIIPAGAQRAVFSGPCIPRWPSADSTRLTVTAAGIGLPIPGSFEEIEEPRERGVSFEDHRSWRVPPNGHVSYRVVPAIDLERDQVVDSVPSQATEIRSCDATIDGRSIHVYSMTFPPGYALPGPTEEVHAWIPTGDGRMVTLIAQGAHPLRDTVLALLGGLRIGLAPSHAEFPHAPGQVASTLAPDSVLVGDSVAYRGHFQLAGGDDHDNRIALYNTKSADVINLEHRQGDTLAVVGRLVLPPSIRVDDFAVYTVCRINGKADPEVFAFYRLDRQNRPAEHPELAWRANRQTFRFEPVTTVKLECEPEDDGGDDGSPAAEL